jgi:hypothetical protein
MECETRRLLNHKKSHSVRQQLLIAVADLGLTTRTHAIAPGKQTVMRIWAAHLSADARSRAHLPLALEHGLSIVDNWTKAGIFINHIAGKNPARLAGSTFDSRR